MHFVFVFGYVGGGSLFGTFGQPYTSVRFREMNMSA